MLVPSATTHQASTAMSFTSQESRDLFHSEVYLLRRIFTQALFRSIGTRYQLRTRDPIEGGEKGQAKMREWWNDPDKINRSAHERSYAAIGQLMLHEKKGLSPDVYESILKYWHCAVGPSLTPERAIELRVGATPETKQYAFSNWTRMPPYHDTGVRTPVAETPSEGTSQVSPKRIRWKVFKR